MSDTPEPVTPGDVPVPDSAQGPSTATPGAPPQFTSWPPPASPPGGGWSPQFPAPAPGALWPPVPAGYYRPLKSPYDQRPPFRPGPMFCLVAALVACFGIVGASGVDLGYVEAISAAVGMLVGLLWLVALINDTQESHWRYDRRGWVRWGTPPAIFLAAFIVICSSAPSIVRFDLSESAMQQTASQTTDGTGYGLRWIGLYEFYDVRVDGPMRFFDLTLPTDSSGLCSFAYAPAQTADFDRWITTSWSVRSLGQDWWYGCQGTRYGD